MMNTTATALAAMLLLTGSALASDQTDVMAAVHRWVDNIDAGDSRAALAACADQTSLVDDIPPYEWSGQGACARWFDAFDASVKLNEITEPSVMLGKTKHLEVTGDRAYVVAPARHVFKERGALVNQAGIVTVALQKDASGWRMTAWIWSEQ